MNNLILLFFLDFILALSKKSCKPKKNITNSTEKNTFFYVFKNTCIRILATNLSFYHELSDIKFNQKNDKSDLFKKFDLDLSERKSLAIINKNKKIDISVNDKVIASTEYIENLGEIAEISFSFKGNGTIYNYSLTDGEGGEVKEELKEQ